jgi:Putative Actinobacterial Holin-X, holin superfamily III
VQRDTLPSVVAVEEQESARSVTELLEQLGRELAALVFAEAQLETARQMPAVRRGAVGGVAALSACAAFFAAFAFLNVAAFVGLSESLSGWLSALVLAGGWIVIGCVIAFVLLTQVRRARFWKVFSAKPAEALAELAQARDTAAASVRETLQDLGPAVTIEIASAAVPAAGDIAEGLLDTSDEMVEALAEKLPAGSVVNQIWGVALMPGRFGIRVATTVLKRDDATAG